MKIVTHTEMLALPVGTVFSFFGEDKCDPRGNLIGSLYIKGETIRSRDGVPIDFQMLNMLPQASSAAALDDVEIEHLAVGEREGYLEQIRWQEGFLFSANHEILLS